MNSEEGYSARFSDTATEKTLYYGVKLENGDILRLSKALPSVMEAASGTILLILGTTAALAAIGVIAAYAISGSIASKIDKMARMSEELASGNYNMRMPETGADTETRLASSFNSMADSLTSTIWDLTRQKAGLNGVLSSISDGILSVDRDLKLTMINDTAKSLLGLKGEVMTGSHLLQSVRAPKLEEAFKRAMLEARPVSFEDIGSEDLSVLSITASPVRLETGEITGAVASIRDISGVRQLETMRSEFVSNVTHELKTPLTSIKGFAQTLVNEEDAKAREHFLGIIEGEADRMSKLVDDIMALSEIEAVGTGDGEADLAAETRSAAGLMAPLAAAKEITITVDAESGLILKAEPSMVRRLALNLIDNAVKYTDRGGKVQVMALRVGGSIVLEVKDNGIGILPEHQKRVFERFYRVDKSRSREGGGTGLGLSIVKHIAKSLGGVATVTSEPGKGSTFKVTVPGGRQT